MHHEIGDQGHLCSCRVCQFLPNLRKPVLYLRQPALQLLPFTDLLLGALQCQGRGKTRALELGPEVCSEHLFLHGMAALLTCLWH